MAGAGKSTIGPLLADQLQYHFVDTDDLIADSGAASLQQLLDTLGQKKFQALEEQTLLALNMCCHVVATGGSAVYSRPGMKHLQEIATVVWLDVELEELESRVDNLDSRGLVNPNGIGFAELYRQRLDLYREYADVRIDCTDKRPKEIVREIFDQIEQHSY
jgi:shikimate kinase